MKRGLWYWSLVVRRVRRVAGSEAGSRSEEGFGDLFFLGFLVVADAEGGRKRSAQNSLSGRETTCGFPLAKAEVLCETESENINTRVFLGKDQDLFNGNPAVTFVLTTHVLILSLLTSI